MNKMIIRLIGVVSCIVFIVIHANALDTRVLQSCVFPGMGQLSDGQALKGLVYMGGEIALITGTFEFAAKSWSYARETDFYKMQKDHIDTTSDMLNTNKQRWDRAYTNARNSQYLTATLGSVAVGLWAWNIVDCIMFKPVRTEENSLLSSTRNKLCLSIDPYNASLRYTVSF